MMALFKLSVVLVIGTLLDLFFMAFFVMVNSSFIHNYWWSDVPSFNFSESFLIGAVLICFSFVFSDIGEKTFDYYIMGSVLALFVAPFIVPFLIGELNNTIFTFIPDISGGTVFVLSLIGAVFGLANKAISKAVKLVITAVD